MSDLPGVRRTQPSRFRPRFHWELLVCGVGGHRLVGIDAAELDPHDTEIAREIDGVRWYRCLRCDSWLPLGAPSPPARQKMPARAEIELPLRGRPLRDRVVLRVIALDRLLHFVVLALIGAAILLFSADRATLRDKAYKVVADLQGGGVATGGDRSGLRHHLDTIFSLQSSQLHLFAAIALLYALVEGLEAIGLWYGKRWAEYLTLIVTASLLPFEVFEMSERFSPLKVVTFAINVAVVVYLLYAKRLFGIRGGARAEEELRARDMGWAALERSSP